MAAEIPGSNATPLKSIHEIGSSLGAEGGVESARSEEIVQNGMRKWGSLQLVVYPSRGDLSNDRISSIPNVSKKAAGYPMGGSCARGALLRLSEKYSW